MNKENTDKKLIIGSRGSQLALWQANHVADLLQALPEVNAVKIVPTRMPR